MEDEKVFVHTTAFNSVLKKFIRFACDKSVALKTNRIKQRVSLLINDAPLLVLEKAGPYILKYADNIKARDEQFYMTVDVTEHFDETDGEDLQKNVIALVNEARKIYSTKCNEEEKEYLNDLADDLLISYCSYMYYIRQKEKK
jgi:hypothetical protein